jgi:hypothetical protein
MCSADHDCEITDCGTLDGGTLTDCGGGLKVCRTSCPGDSDAGRIRTEGGRPGDAASDVAAQ